MLKDSIREFFIPIIVGVTALAVMDQNFLGDSEQGKFFKNLLLDVRTRWITLFGASYAATGGRIVPSLLAVYSYFLLWSNATTKKELKQEVVEAEEEKINIIDEFLYPNHALFQNNSPESHPR